MKGRRVGQDPVAIHGIILPEKLPRTGKRRRMEDILQEQGLLDDEPQLVDGQAQEAMAEARSPVEQTVPESEEVADTPKSAADDDDVEIMDIPVSSIITSKYQPRLVIDQEKLEALADEIHAAGGLNNPVNVLPRENGQYELITGERRWRAHLHLGWPNIKARIRRISDKEAQVIALTDNTSGEPLTAFEEALAVKKNLDSGSFTSMNDLAKRMGKHKSTLSRQLSFFKLPEEILVDLERAPATLSMHPASEMAAYADEHPELVIQAYNEIKDGSLPSSRVGKWLNLQARKKNQESKKGMRGYNRSASRVIPLSSPPDVAVTQVKITGKRITFECQGDPQDTLQKMAQALGIHFLEGTGANQSDDEAETAKTEGSMQ